MPQYVTAISSCLTGLKPKGACDDFSAFWSQPSLESPRFSPSNLSLSFRVSLCSSSSTNLIDFSLLPPNCNSSSPRFCRLKVESQVSTQIGFAYFVPVAYHLWLTALFLTIVLLTTCFCCLYLPHVYREFLELALMNQSSHS